ncbi:bacteriophage T4 gp5 trimerisation domain-containing protein [Halomonas sp. PA16-9]|uniref:bacteriophage T4 gp5 trimerisation domain-containing protein n=1 Tax=Halomonas sp. PA16-9 TaxID=2576841 RepID=UPI0030ED6ACB
MIRTQSHKSEGFNELRFEDATGEEQIWLHAQKTWSCSRLTTAPRRSVGTAT